MQISSIMNAAAIIAALGYTPASSGAVVMADGSAGSPGMPFGAESSSGFHRPSAGVMGISILGSDVASLAATGLAVAVAGTASAPSVQVGSSGLGWYKTTGTTSGGTSKTALGLGFPGGLGTQGDQSYGVGPVITMSTGYTLYGATKFWWGEGNPFGVFSLYTGPASAGAMMGLASIAQFNNSSAASEPALLMLRSRGTVIGTLGAVQANDVLQLFQWCGDDGTTALTNYNVACNMQVLVDGTVSTGVVPGRLQVQITATGGAFNTVMDIRQDQSVAFAGTLRASGGLARFDNASAPTVRIEQTTGGVAGNIGFLDFYSYNTTPAGKQFVQIFAHLDTATAGSEQGSGQLLAMLGGTLTAAMSFGGAGGISVGSTSLYGAGIINATAGYYFAGSVIVDTHGKVSTLASTTTSAGLRLNPGTAPTSPAEGDIWYDSSAHNIKYRDNSGAKTITAS